MQTPSSTLRDISESLSILLIWSSEAKAGQQFLCDRSTTFPTRSLCRILLCGRSDSSQQHRLLSNGRAMRPVVTSHPGWHTASRPSQHGEVEWQAVILELTRKKSRSRTAVRDACPVLRNSECTPAALHVRQAALVWKPARSTLPHKKPLNNKPWQDWVSRAENRD